MHSAHNGHRLTKLAAFSASNKDTNKREHVKHENRKLSHSVIMLKTIQLQTDDTNQSTYKFSSTRPYSICPNRIRFQS